MGDLVKAGENLFSPLEAAYQRHAGSDEEREKMDRFFQSMAFDNPVPPGAYVELRALMDLICVVSSCPFDLKCACRTDEENTRVPEIFTE